MPAGSQQVGVSGSNIIIWSLCWFKGENVDLYLNDGEWRALFISDISWHLYSPLMWFGSSYLIHLSPLLPPGFRRSRPPHVITTYPSPHVHPPVPPMSSLHLISCVFFCSSFSVVGHQMFYITPKNVYFYLHIIKKIEQQSLFIFRIERISLIPHI